MNLIQQGLRIAQDPRQTKWVAPLLLLADAALCVLIVWKIPYTEIDWKAYMQQSAIYISGERDYVKLRGDTGPLVYPAAHVYIYRLLYEVTDSGRDIRLAQYIFIGVYLFALACAMQCYRLAGAPPYIFSLLILSKRLHSIFLLRLFNDGFAVAFLFAAVYCWQRRLWTVGSVLFTLGLGVKMTLLLALPAVGLVLWQGSGRFVALQQGALMVQVQVILGMPFLTGNARNYLSRAFELTRQFLFKWTVNWRFVGEDVFLSRSFSTALLAAHAAVLLLFILTRWLPLPLTESIQILIQGASKDVEARLGKRTTPKFVLTTILTSMIIGCLCARSLHYQFYAYIAWSTPFLLWRSGMHPVAIYALWVVQEIAWNIYPSTNVSSAIVVSALAVTVFSVWIGASLEPHADDSVLQKKEK